MATRRSARRRTRLIAFACGREVRQATRATVRCRRCPDRLGARWSRERGPVQLPALSGRWADRAALAQSAERLTRNEKVVGSIPTGGSVVTCENVGACQIRARCVGGGSTSRRRLGPVGATGTLSNEAVADLGVVVSAAWSGWLARVHGVDFGVALVVLGDVRAPAQLPGDLSASRVAIGRGAGLAS